MKPEQLEIAAQARGGEGHMFVVEITKAAGMRIRLENISVSAQVAKIFELDSIGKFYFLGDGPNHYLLGIERADGVQAFDPRDISLDDLRNFIEGD